MQADDDAGLVPMGARIDKETLRALPGVGTFLRRPGVERLARMYGQGAVARAVRATVDQVRAALVAGANGDVTERDVAMRAKALALGTLRPVLNGTGVVIHTNLGRAPLAPQAVAAAIGVGASYSSLEYDLVTGERGDRHAHLTDLLRELTGAEDAVVVNNNAAAVLLALSAIAAGREVVVSRGELVEIGGGFRIPDVLRQSGARLVEVGTTNRTHLSDYEAALGDRTALLLKVHPSNFTQIGFTASVSVAELAELAARRSIPLLYDAGSGCVDAEIDRSDDTVGAHLRHGADLVAFSGDKLLGGPQSGIVVGRATLIDAIRRHPLMRAVRPDKLCVAALGATLRLWLDAPDEVPVARMIAASSDSLARRAEKLAAEIASLSPGAPVSAATTIARVGGGTSPRRELESRGLRFSVADPDAFCRRLRDGDPPLVARIETKSVLVDLRCIHPDDDGRLRGAILEALRDGP